MITNSKKPITVTIYNFHGWWIIEGNDDETPQMKYLYFTKAEAKSRYYMNFIKPLHKRHRWVEL